MSWSVWMSPAVTGPGPFLTRRSSALSRECMRMATALRFSRTSTTSSCTPSMLVYSWSTPSISTSVMAAPGIDDSSTRRRALPSVCPKPRSKGSITTRAWRGATGCTFTTRGFRNSFTEDCIEPPPSLRVQLNNEIFVDVWQYFITAWGRLEHTTHLFLVDFEPLGKTNLRRNRQRVLDAQLLAGLFANLHHVTGLHLVRRDGYGRAVNLYTLVTHQLPGFGAGDRKSHAVHD